MDSYLVAKGATGIAAVDIQGKSRKELTIENRNKTEINISKNGPMKSMFKHSIGV